MDASLESALPLNPPQGEGCDGEPLPPIPAIDPLAVWDPLRIWLRSYTRGDAWFPENCPCGQFAENFDAAPRSPVHGIES